MSTSPLTLARLKQEIETLSPSDQIQVLECIIRIACHKFKPLDPNHIPRLIAAIQANSSVLVQREMQYANEKLGANYDLSTSGVNHD